MKFIPAMRWSISIFPHRKGLPVLAVDGHGDLPRCPLRLPPRVDEFAAEGVHGKHFRYVGVLPAGALATVDAEVVLNPAQGEDCLLYTSDAADEEDSVDL